MEPRRRRDGVPVPGNTLVEVAWYLDSHDKKGGLVHKAKVYLDGDDEYRALLKAHLEAQEHGWAGRIASVGRLDNVLYIQLMGD